MNELRKKSSEFVLDGAKLSLENAENHFEAGEILAEKSNFGLAVSHLILAAEESAKSLTLLAKYNETYIKKTDIPIDKVEIVKLYENYNFSKLFYRHKPKQSLAVFVSIFGQIMVELSPWPISVINKILFEGKEPNQNDIDKVLETKRKQEKRIKDWKRQSVIPDLGLQENSDWWKQVNYSKNNGLYAGLENNKWKTPNSFTTEDYKLACDNVSIIIALLERLLEMEEEIITYKKDNSKIEGKP